MMSPKSMLGITLKTSQEDRRHLKHHSCIKGNIWLKVQDSSTTVGNVALIAGADLPVRGQVCARVEEQ